VNFAENAQESDPHSHALEYDIFTALSLPESSLKYCFATTEQLKITDLQFAGTPSNETMTITMQNTAASPVTITEVYMNNGTSLPFSGERLTLGSRQRELDNSQLQLIHAPKTLPRVSGVGKLSIDEAEWIVQIA
jgi:hypothetical protein